jgi:hypothetical protein
VEPLTTELPPHLQKLIDMGESGTDIMHGELKNLMYEAEQELLEAQRIEEENDYDDAMESMERKYWEGQCDALAGVYALTYQLAFAIQERTQKNG